MNKKMLLLMLASTSIQLVAMDAPKESKRPRQDDDMQDSRLIDAVIQGRIQEVNQLLASGVNVNQRNKNGTSPLQIAAANNYIEILNKLIAAGANVNQISNQGVTALMRAALYNNFEVIEQLIKAGANTNQADNEGKTALMFLVEQRSPNQEFASAIVNKLIAGGAKINQANNDGYTALGHAVANSRLTFVKAFIAAGADVNYKDKGGNTTLKKILTKPINMYPDLKEIAFALIDAGARI